MEFTKKIEGNELYVYADGELIYKRWLDTGQSKVFDVMAYDKHTLVSITEPETHQGKHCFLSKTSKGAH